MFDLAKKERGVLSQILTAEGYNLEFSSVYSSLSQNDNATPKIIIIDAIDKSITSIINTISMISKPYISMGVSKPSIIAIVDISSKNKQHLFTHGIQDYISNPIINEELLYRVKCATTAFRTMEEYDDSSQLKDSSSTLKYVMNKPDDFLVKKTVEYLKTQIGTNIKLNEVTRKMGTNRNKLSSAFNQAYGISVFHWIRLQRMKSAADLLINTTLTILQVSERVGYLDSNNFSTSFKRSFKLSPRQYRKENSFMQ